MRIELALGAGIDEGAGLVIGKQIGVFGVTWILVKAGVARMPHGANWVHIAGLAFLAGIGFTMSLFIGGLSFTDQMHMNEVRLGVIAGSAVSAVLGYGLLRFVAGPEAKEASPAPVISAG